MLERVSELQSYWRSKGVPKDLMVRVGIATGFCTVGNFGSDQRLDYTVLGSPVNLAARLQTMAEPGSILLDQNTAALLEGVAEIEVKGEVVPRGFARPVNYFELKQLASSKRHELEHKISHVGRHVEVKVIDSSDIRAAIEELREIQLRFEAQLRN